MTRHVSVSSVEKLMAQNFDGRSGQAREGKYKLVRVAVCCEAVMLTNIAMATLGRDDLANKCYDGLDPVVIHSPLIGSNINRWIDTVITVFIPPGGVNKSIIRAKSAKRSFTDKLKDLGGITSIQL